MEIEKSITRRSKFTGKVREIWLRISLERFASVGLKSSILLSFAVANLELVIVFE